MGFSSNILSDFGTILEGQIQFNRTVFKARIKQDYYGKHLEIKFTATARLGKVPVGIRFKEFTLNAKEVTDLAEGMRNILEQDADIVIRQAGLLEKSLRFGNSILSEKQISEKGNLVIGRYRIRLLSFLQNSERGIVVHFDYSFIGSFIRTPMEMNKEEAKRFLDILEGIIKTRSLESSQFDVKIPYWKEIIGSIPGVLPAALFTPCCPPIGILGALQLTAGLKSKYIAYVISLIPILLVFNHLCNGLFGLNKGYTLTLEPEYLGRAAKAELTITAKKNLIVQSENKSDIAIEEGKETKIPLKLKQGENKFLFTIIVDEKKQEETIQLYRLTKEEHEEEKKDIPIQSCDKENLNKGIFVKSIIAENNIRILIGNSCPFKINNLKVKMCEGSRRERDTRINLEESWTEILPGRARWYKISSFVRVDLECPISVYGENASK